VVRALVAAAGVAGVTATYYSWLHVTNSTIVALSYLLVILFVAASSPLWVGIGASVGATLALDFFFFPPVGEFTIADPENWVALGTFLTVSVVASELSSAARNRRREAEARRDEVSRLATERIQLLEERKEAEISRRGNELRSTLLASLAHDLRTPLTAIRVAVGNLRASNLTETQRSEQAEVALNGVERLTRRFDNILEMSRLDVGGVAPTVRWVYAAEVIVAARREVDQSVHAHQVRVVDQSTEVSVRLDPRLVSVALAHVIENAAHYSPAGSTITITAALGPDGLAFSVGDEGPGIPAEDLPKIFDRFYRGGEGHRHPSGTGMGLTIAQGLLATMGGRIWAENRHGGGAQLCLLIPVEISGP
jgi:two-component system, OmpR family, sensor histidine kinase KdpD